MTSQVIGRDVSSSRFAFEHLVRQCRSFALRVWFYFFAYRVVTCSHCEVFRLPLTVLCLNSLLRPRWAFGVAGHWRSRLYRVIGGIPGSGRFRYPHLTIPIYAVNRNPRNSHKKTASNWM